MKLHPSEISKVVENSKCCLDNLILTLRFIEACFEYLPYDKKNGLSLSFAYHDGHDYDFNSKEDIFKELKRSISFQTEEHFILDIEAWINYHQTIIVDGLEIELSYGGPLTLYNGNGWMAFNFQQRPETLSVNLLEKINSETMISLYVNIQESIKEQIKFKLDQHDESDPCKPLF